MALRNIVTTEDPILRKVCRPVDEVNDRIKTMLGDMLETMRAYNGVGIAAPQVGILRRMFIAEPEPGTVYYMINPEIIEESGTQTSVEGCLSVPGYIGTVERPEYLKIKALDIDGTERTLEFHDFEAVVMSHENDHLNGIVYTDKATNIQKADEMQENMEEEE